MIMEMVMKGSKSSKCTANDNKMLIETKSVENSLALDNSGFSSILYISKITNILHTF